MAHVAASSPTDTGIGCANAFEYPARNPTRRSALARRQRRPFSGFYATPAAMPPVLVGLLLLTFFDLAVAENYKNPEEIYDKLYQHLKKKYDRRIRPFLGIKPVDVDVTMFVSSLRSISEATMDYKLELYFREYWQDPRLAYNPKRYNNMTIISLHESFADLLWVPDTFLPNAVHSANPDQRSITHRVLLRLEPDGHLLYSRRLSVTAECPMDLSLYPFDEQVCILSIESYGYSTTDIIYSWVKKDPIVLNEHLQLPDFKLKHVSTKSHNVTLSTGTYSRLEACFFFVRNSGFYFVQLFLPATAIVITSWLSLWMEQESTFSDMIEVILAITFLYYSVNNVMPRVSYIKALDIYLGACFIFVFISLISLAVLKMMKFSNRLGRQRMQRDANGNGSTTQLFGRRRSRPRSFGDKTCDEHSRMMESDEDLFDPEKTYARQCSPSPCAVLETSIDNPGIPSKINPLREASPAAPPPPPLPPLLLPSSVANNNNNNNNNNSTSIGRMSGSFCAPSSSAYDSGFNVRPSMVYKRHLRLDSKNGAVPSGVGVGVGVGGGRTGQFSDFFLKTRQSSGRRSTVSWRNAKPSIITVRVLKVTRRIALILFPITFTMFCVLYFIAYFVMVADNSNTRCVF